jgi:phospholipid-binding lipoprotein MlaA
MSVAALTVALLLAAAPAHASEPQPVAPILPTLPAPAEQAPPAPATSTSTPTPAEAAAPTPDPDADSDEILVSGKRGAPPGDPLEAINVQTYEVVQAVDKTAVAPLAHVYEKTLPEPLRDGVRNFFNNLAEPVVFLNFLIQLKPGKAVETLGRFALNSTIGAAGLVDVAKRKPFKLPLRRNGFANSMGYYGIKTGAFLFLPLVGPTTVRDLIGLTLDKLVVPTIVGKPFNQLYYTIPASTVSSLDYRVEFDEQLREQRESADPYAASRENYLRNRQAEIDALHGRPPAAVAPVSTSTGPLVTPVILPTPDATAPDAAVPTIAPPPDVPHE